MRDLGAKLKLGQISRRDFLKGSAAATAAIAGVSLVGCKQSDVNETTTQEETTTEATTEAPIEHTPIEPWDDSKGYWQAAACMYNCGGHCLNRVYVEDGIVLRQKTDDLEADSLETPQMRGCLRGRALRKHVFGADRIKYPMKRKHWEPKTGGRKELRGIDEWERISWEEAFKYVGDEIKHIVSTYGNRSIVLCGYTQYSDFAALFRNYGGYVGTSDTASFGTAGYTPLRIGLGFRGLNEANDRFDFVNAEYIVLYGMNGAWASPGNQCWHIWEEAKEKGVQFVFVGPEYNPTATLFEAKWIRVRPATDTAFLLGVAHTMFTEDDPAKNPIIDWDFLEKYTIGIDGDHMPENPSVNENFKDYVLGKYDGIPKDAKWASEICGAPEEDIVWYARLMAKQNKVMTLHSYAPARANDSDDWMQMMMTIACMGGHMGKSGHCMGSGYHGSLARTGPALVKPGSAQSVSSDSIAANPVDDCINVTQIWDVICNGGKYNCTGDGLQAQYKPQDLRDIDIRMIIHDNSAGINTLPTSKQAIAAHRKLDFVLSTAAHLTTNAKYSDIVLPIVTDWEITGKTWGGGAPYWNREAVTVYQGVIPPQFEAVEREDIITGIAKELGIDTKILYKNDRKTRFINEVATCTYLADDGSYKPLVTITQADLDEWKVEAPIQTGLVGLKKFLQDGVYKVKRSRGDKYEFIGHEAFIKDPVKNRKMTASGKFEIFCESKAAGLNAIGYTKDFVWKPYPSYKPPVNGYEESFKDWKKKEKGEYPYQLYTPHYLRRSHSVFDNVGWLREAMKNPIILNAADAKEKGIEQGDTVLIFNEYGKVLRHAWVTERMMPGCVALPHGGWVELDEDEAVDYGGNENMLLGQETSGCGVSGYNTCLVDYMKWTGDALIEDALRPIKVVEF